MIISFLDESADCLWKSQVMSPRYLRNELLKGINSNSGKFSVEEIPVVVVSLRCSRTSYWEFPPFVTQESSAI